MHWILICVPLIAIFAYLRQGFRKAQLPVSVARGYGTVQFSLWRWLFLEPLYPWLREKPWKDVIENSVWLGKCPLPRHVAEMRRLGITRVINLQDEYVGPVESYRAAGIIQLYLPVVDHYEPTHAQLNVAVEFLREALAEGRKCYVHCQGGHGRSAAVVFALLALDRAENESLIDVNRKLFAKWRVRTHLHSQPAILSYLSEKKKL